VDPLSSAPLPPQAVKPDGGQQQGAARQDMGTRQESNVVEIRTPRPQVRSNPYSGSQQTDDAEGALKNGTFGSSSR